MLNMRVSVAILLPNGVGRACFSLYGFWNGIALEFVVSWLDPPLDFQLIHTKWLKSPDIRYEEYHPECVGFSEFLQEFRSRTCDWIKFKAEIIWPFRTDKHDSYVSPFPLSIDQGA